MLRARSLIRRVGIVASGIVCITTVALLIESTWVSFEIPYERHIAAGIERCRFVIEHGKLLIDNAPQVAADNQLRARLTDADQELKLTWGILFLDLDSDMPSSAERIASVHEKRQRYLALAREKVELQRAAESPPPILWVVSIPWFVPAMFAAVLAIAPIQVLRRKRQEEQRRAFGLCEGCGYDIRESPDKCPECGRLNPMKEKI
jgi:hypothetical protein